MDTSHNPITNPLTSTAMAIEQSKLARLQKLNKKFSYAVQSWETTEEYSLQEWTEVEPRLKHAKEIVCVAKPHKDEPEKFFLKWVVYLTGGSLIEFELPYKNDFDEGDTISLDSAKFCVEECLGKTHLYLTGELA